MTDARTLEAILKDGAEDGRRLTLAVSTKMLIMVSAKAKRGLRYVRTDDYVDGVRIYRFHSFLEDDAPLAPAAEQPA